MAASGTSTGLAGVPRIVGRDADPRLRRLAQWLGGTSFIAQNGGVIINQNGQLDTNPAVIFQQLLAYEQANPAFLGRL